MQNLSQELVKNRFLSYFSSESSNSVMFWRPCLQIRDALAVAILWLESCLSRLVRIGPSLNALNLRHSFWLKTNANLGEKGLYRVKDQMPPVYYSGNKVQCYIILSAHCLPLLCGTWTFLLNYLIKFLSAFYFYLQKVHSLPFYSCVTQCPFLPKIYSQIILKSIISR